MNDNIFLYWKEIKKWQCSHTSVCRTDFHKNLNFYSFAYHLLIPLSSEPPGDILWTGFSKGSLHCCIETVWEGWEKYLNPSSHWFKTPFSEGLLCRNSNFYFHGICNWLFWLFNWYSRKWGKTINTDHVAKLTFYSSNTRTIRYSGRKYLIWWLH